MEAVKVETDGGYREIERDETVQRDKERESKNR